MRAQMAGPVLERPHATSSAGVRRSSRWAADGQGGARSDPADKTTVCPIANFDGAPSHGGGPCGGGLGTPVGLERRWTATTRQRARGE